MMMWIYLCGLIVLTLLILKIVVSGFLVRDNSYTCLLGKTVIVTGANTGIGFYAAQDFAKRGAKVILACRNQDKAEKAKKQIIENTRNPNIYVELVDFSSLKSVRKLAERLNSELDRLDILVNNAAVMMFEDVTTEDGLTMSMQVNYFGPFLLTMLLIDLIRATKSSRIVNLSSRTVFVARLKPNNLNYITTSFKSNFFYTNYANSKFCVMLWTNELARRLKGTGITINSLHAGGSYTELLRHTSTCMRITFWFASFFILRTPEEGAQTVIYAAVSKELRNVSGKFLINCKITGQPHKAHDEALAKKVWESTENFVKLTKDERKL